MANHRIIYEAGVEIRRQPNGCWYYFPGASENYVVNEISPEGVCSAFGLKPIFIEAVSDAMHDTTLLLPSVESIDKILMADGPAFFTLPQDCWFDVRIEMLFSKMLEIGISITAAEKVAYIPRSVSYHCRKLADNYSLVRSDFSAMQRLDRESKSGEVLFSANCCVWFEFDALVTAVRRAYDSTSSILWNVFGNRVDCPDAFYETYPKCERLPKYLRDRLEGSWKKVGMRVTSYRNNVQHYANMEFGMCSVKMIPMNDFLWGMKVLIPDNPEVRSRNKLQYKEEVDALSYGWKIACEVLDVISSIIDAVELTKLRSA